MALEISSIEDTGMSMDSSGWTRTRQKLVSAESWEELYSGGAFPSYGSRHPENVLFKLESASMTPVGNEAGKIQVLWVGTYKMNRNTDKSSGDSTSDVDPWDLGAQDIQLGFSTEQVPMTKGYNQNGELVDLLNSAHCLINAETSKTLTDLTFLYCVKAKSSNEPPLFQTPIINSTSETVAGFTIPAMCGMLMPVSPRLIIEYEDDDPSDEKRRYWEISVHIKLNPDGWSKEFLDVGTMAIFDAGVPEPIYQYQPNAGDPTPVYGSIHMLRKAQAEYEKKNPGQKMSWTEVTEPLPLREGKIYLDALKGTRNAYDKIKVYEFLPGSWASLDLPRKRG
jgi:hypothetical protein